ncbi:MAG: hypothetical protein HY738_04090 [Bacteroidia bacterium]|nr:hypothetical protein [Bacteroidia bacterium]
MHSILNGLDYETEFEYKPITDAAVYAKGTGAVYPLVDIQAPIYVVSSVKTDNGLNSKDEITYFYTGAKLHYQGKGFLGFNIISATNQTTQITATDEYEFEFQHFGEKYYSSYLKKSTLTDNTDFDFKQTIYINKTQPRSNINCPDEIYRLIFYRENIGKHDYLTNSTVNTVYNWDINDNNTFDYGNIPSIDIVYNDGVKQSTSYIYTDVGLGYPSKVEKETITKTRPEDTDAYTRTIDYTYEGFMVKTITTDLGKEKRVIKTYDYDCFGNVIKTTVSSPQLAPLVTSAVYDAQGIFPVKTYNALDQLSETVFDYSTGNIKMSKDINGLKTYYNYDMFGRLTETILPNGNKISNSIHWLEGSSPEYGAYYTVTSGDGLPDVTEYYDIIGRKLKTETEGFDAHTIYEIITYNTEGKVETSSMPYYQGGATNNTTYLYDKYGRIEYEISPVCTLSYVYNGSTVEVTNSGMQQTFSKTYTADGLLDYASDDAGAIDYTYFSSGLTKLIVSVGQTVSMTYDEYGRQTGLSDLNTG